MPRLTVGPLPPSVYWRRRALVVGVLGLIVLGIVYAVSGTPAPDPPGSNLADSSSPTATTTVTVTPTQTAYTLPVATITGQATGSAAAGNACTDQEIELTASSTTTDIQIREPVVFGLKVRNISNRTCTRDIGSIPQELRLRDAQGDIVWSSDDCTNVEPYHDEQMFAPGFEKSFSVSWDGYRSRDSAGFKACGTTIRPAGTLQLIARLGTLYSAPLTLIVRAGS